MSFLKDTYRGSRFVKLTGPTYFGDPAKEKKDKGKTPFDIAFDKLVSKLQQADLRGDFGDDAINLFGWEDRDVLRSREADKLFGKAKLIQTSLVKFSGDESKIAGWFKTNQILVAEFLRSLDEIYKKRTCSAKIKDFLWELADALVVTLAAVGLAVGVIKLAGLGIFGGAFASYVASPATTATTPAVVKEIVGATGAMALTATGFYKFFRSEKGKLKAAIEETLKLSAPGSRK